MNLIEKFEKMGARLKIVDAPRGLSLNIRSDNKGEYFEISKPQNTDLSILDLQPQDRHLLLFAKEEQDREVGGGISVSKQKFLCGHDERHWFVAGIPESAPVGTVQQAKQSLKPKEIRDTENKKKVSTKKKYKRKNDVSVRQGEWFFIPATNLSVNKDLILKNEPLRRGRGKPHNAEFCYRLGGESVIVCSNFPNGLRQKAYEELIRTNPAAKNWNWRWMKRDASVYVKGRISHADHKTLVLKDWHRVVMNEEFKAASMRNVAFLD